MSENGQHMPKITFKKAGVDQPISVVNCAKGETILDAALGNDVPLEHACGGFCACTTCQVLVISGAENLVKMEGEEDDRLHDSSKVRKPNSRLGCQAKVNGDVVVEIVNVGY